MKLRLPTRIYRALINGIGIISLTCGIQVASAQEELTTETISNGEQENYTEASDLEGKSIVVQGTLTTNISDSEATRPTRFDVTVQDGGKWGNDGFLISQGEGSSFHFTVMGEDSTFTNKAVENSNEADIQIRGGGEITFDVKDGGAVTNEGAIEVWSYGSINSGEITTGESASKLSITVDGGTFTNAEGGSISCEGRKTTATTVARDTSKLPTEQFDITLKNGGEFINKGEMHVSNESLLKLTIDGEGSTFTNNHAFRISHATKEDVAHEIAQINISNGGSFVNQFGTEISPTSGSSGYEVPETRGLYVGNGAEADINIDGKESSFVNKAKVEAWSLESDYHSQLRINVNGGSFENSYDDEDSSGLVEAGDYSSLSITVKDGGTFNNTSGTLQHGETDSALMVNIEDGTFNNMATKGNADVTVGEKGTMTGWGAFGSNDVYGTLIVGSSETGLDNPTLKHQSYSGNFTLHSGAALTFYIEGRNNYSQIFVGGQATGSDWGSVRAAVVVTSEMMAQSVADGNAFLNPSYIALVDADGNEIKNVSSQLGIEYYGEGVYANYYYVDPRTGSLLPDLEALREAVVSGSAELIDTLWSSTGAVRDLSRTALSQVFLPCYNAERTRAEASAAMTGRRPMYCRRPNVWVAGLGGFMNMGGSSAFTYSGGGYAVGADAPVGAYGRVGAAFGQSFGDFSAKHSSTSVDQTGIMFSIYGGFEKPINEKRSHRASAYFGYGVVDNDARTSLMGVESGAANWDDEAFVFGLEYAMDFHVRDSLTVSPFVGIEYVYGSQSGYAESFSGGMVRRYDGATMQYWRIPVGCAVRHSCALGDKQYLVSELAVGYIGDVSRHNPHGRVNVGGVGFNVEGSNPGRNALMLRAGTNWLINQNWTVGAQYHLEARSRQTSQSVNAYVRYTF